MSFAKATDGDARFSKDAGLPDKWENLVDYACPKCGKTLQGFEHLKLWKCFCGFRISVKRRDEIAEKIEDGQDFDRSFGLNNYEDDPPF